MINPLHLLRCLIAD